MSRNRSNRAASSLSGTTIIRYNVRVGPDGFAAVKNGVLRGSVLTMIELTQQTGVSDQSGASLWRRG